MKKIIVLTDMDGNAKYDLDNQVGYVPISDYMDSHITARNNQFARLVLAGTDWTYSVCPLLMALKDTTHDPIRIDICPDTYIHGESITAMLQNIRPILDTSKWAHVLITGLSLEESKAFVDEVWGVEVITDLSDPSRGPIRQIYGEPLHYREEVLVDET